MAQKKSAGFNLFFRYFKQGKSTGQLAVFFILALAVIFLFVAITANLQKVSQRKTLLSVAADQTALASASQLASMALNFYRHETDEWNWSAIFMLIVIIAVTIATWGAGTAAATAASAAALHTAAITFAIITGSAWLFNQYITGKQLSRMAGLFRNWETPIQIHEGAVRQALSMAIDEPRFVPDIYDDDLDGDTSDYISPWLKWYMERALKIEAVSNTLKKYLKDHFMPELKKFDKELVGKLDADVGIDEYTKILCHPGFDPDSNNFLGFEIKGGFYKFLGGDYREGPWPWQIEDYPTDEGGTITLELHNLKELLTELRSIKTIDENGNEIFAFPIPEDIDQNGIEDLEQIRNAIFSDIGFHQFYCGFRKMGETARLAFFFNWAQFFFNIASNDDWFTVFYGPRVLPTNLALASSGCEYCPAYCAREDDEQCFIWDKAGCLACNQDEHGLPYDLCPAPLGVRNLVSILRYNPLLEEKGVTCSPLYPGTAAIDSLTEIYDEYSNANCQAMDCEGLEDTCAEIYNSCYNNCASDNQQYCEDSCAAECQDPNSEECSNCMTQCYQDICHSPCANDPEYQNCLKKAIACKKVTKLMPAIKDSIERLHKFDNDLMQVFKELIAGLGIGRDADIDWDPTYCWKDSQGEHCVGVAIAPFPFPYLKVDKDLGGLHVDAKLKWIPPLSGPDALDTVFRIKISRYDSNPEEQKYPFWNFRFSRAVNPPTLGISCPKDSYCSQPAAETVWQLLDNYGINVYSSVAYDPPHEGFPSRVRLVSTSPWECDIPYAFGGWFAYWYGAHEGCDLLFEGWNDPFGKLRKLHPSCRHRGPILP